MEVSNVEGEVDFFIVVSSLFVVQEDDVIVRFSVVLVGYEYVEE